MTHLLTKKIPHKMWRKSAAVRQHLGAGAVRFKSHPMTFFTQRLNKILMARLVLLSLLAILPRPSFAGAGSTPSKAGSCVATIRGSIDNAERPRSSQPHEPLVRPTIYRIDHRMLNPGNDSYFLLRIPPPGKEFYISGAGGFPEVATPTIADGQKFLEHWMVNGILAPALDPGIPQLIESIIASEMATGKSKNATDEAFRGQRLDQLRELNFWLHTLAVIFTEYLELDLAELKKQDAVLRPLNAKHSGANDGKTEMMAIVKQKEVINRISTLIESILELIESRKLMAVATEADLVEMLVIADRFNWRLAERTTREYQRSRNIEMLPEKLDQLILRRLVPDPNNWKDNFFLEATSSAVVEFVIVGRLSDSALAFFLHHTADLDIEQWNLFSWVLSRKYPAAEVPTPPTHGRSNKSAIDVLQSITFRRHIATALLDFLKNQISPQQRDAAPASASASKSTAEIRIAAALRTLNFLVNGLKLPPDLIAQIHHEVQGQESPERSAQRLAAIYLGRFSALNSFSSLSEQLGSLAEEPEIARIAQENGIDMVGLIQMVKRIAAIPAFFEAGPKGRGGGAHN